MHMQVGRSTSSCPKKTATTVETTNCTSEHDAGSSTLTSASTTGTSPARLRITTAEKVCISNFKDYVGSHYVTSTLNCDVDASDERLVGAKYRPITCLARLLDVQAHQVREGFGPVGFVGSSALVDCCPADQTPPISAGVPHCYSDLCHGEIVLTPATASRSHHSPSHDVQENGALRSITVGTVAAIGLSLSACSLLLFGSQMKRRAKNRQDSLCP